MATTDPIPGKRGWVHHLSANRLVRRPILFASGILLATIFAFATEPYWAGSCANFTAGRGIPCTPMTAGDMFGYVMIVAGVTTMIFGPIVNSLYRLYRYGQVWETSRVETAVANVPIIVGIVYIVIGFAVAAAVS